MGLRLTRPAANYAIRRERREPLARVKNFALSTQDRSVERRQEQEQQQQRQRQRQQRQHQ